MNWLDVMTPPAPCSVCGTMLSWQVAPSEDRFIWADADGKRVVPTGHPSPWEVLKVIGDQMIAATTGPKRKRGPMPAEEDMQVYSILVGDPNALGRPDLHRHDHQPLHGMGHEPADVPWCCDMPMHLRPSGWHCRERCGNRLDLAA